MDDMSAILAVMNDSFARRIKLLGSPIVIFANYPSKIDSFLVPNLPGGNSVRRLSRPCESVEQSLRIGVGENAPVGPEIIRSFNVFVLLSLLQAIVVSGGRIFWVARGPRPAEGNRRLPQRVDGAAVAAIFLRRLLAQSASFRIELVLLALLAAARTAGRDGTTFRHRLWRRGRASRNGPASLLVARLVGIEFPQPRRQFEAQLLAEFAR